MFTNAAPSHPPPPPPPPSVVKPSLSTGHAPKRRGGLTRSTPRVSLDDDDELEQQQHDEYDAVGGMHGLFGGGGSGAPQPFIGANHSGSFTSVGSGSTRMSLGRMGGARLFGSIREEDEFAAANDVLEQQQQRREAKTPGDPTTLSSPARKALFGMDDDAEDDDEAEVDAPPRALFGGLDDDDDDSPPKALFGVLDGTANGAPEEEEEEATPPRRLFASGSIDTADDDDMHDERPTSSGTVKTADLTTSFSSPPCKLFHGLSGSSEDASPPKRSMLTRERSIHEHRHTDDSDESEDETVVGADDDDDDTVIADTSIDHDADAAAFDTGAGDPSERRTAHRKRRTQSRTPNKSSTGARRDESYDPSSPTGRVLSKVRKLNIHSVDISAAKAEHLRVERVEVFKDRRGSPVQRTKAVDMDARIEEEGSDKENVENRAGKRKSSSPGRRGAFQSLRAEGRIAFDHLDDDAMDDDFPPPPPPAADPASEEDISPEPHSLHKTMASTDSLLDDISPTNVADFPNAAGTGGCDAQQPPGLKESLMRGSFAFDEALTNSQLRCDFYSPPATTLAGARKKVLRPPSQPQFGDSSAAAAPKTPARTRKDVSALVAPGTPKSSRRKPATDANASGSGSGSTGARRATTPGGLNLPEVSSPPSSGYKGGYGTKTLIPPTPAMERQRNRRPVGRTPRGGCDSRDDDSTMGSHSHTGGAGDAATGRFDADFQILGTLGKGSFGVVHRCQSKIDSQVYAVKISRRAVRGHNDRQRMLQEVYALAALSDSTERGLFHVVRYHQAWMENERLHIQTELCSGNLLDQMIAGTSPNSGQQLRPVMASEDRTHLLREMLLALELIHRSGMVHLDIKPENIFLKNGRYKLGDFGLVSGAGKDGSKSSDDIEEGDSRYMSLEMLEGNREDLTKSDIFSLGATLYETSLLSPLPTHGPHWRALRSGHFTPLKHTPEPLIQIITEMMAPNLHSRPCAEELLRRRQLLSECERELITERNRATHANRELEKSQNTQAQQAAAGRGGGGGGLPRGTWAARRRLGGLSNGLPERGQLMRHNTWNGS